MSKMDELRRRISTLVARTELRCMGVELDDPFAISKASLSLIDNGQRYSNTSARAIEDARRRFDIRVVSDLYLELYRALIGQERTD